MTNRIRLSAALLLAVCLALTVISAGVAQKGTLLAGLILNGDFEGEFYPYGSGEVARHWTPYEDPGLHTPEYRRSTLYKYEGEASQLIWADRVPWYAGIKQTTVLTSGQSGARIQTGKRYTVYVLMFSIYGGAGSSVQHGKLNKRVGINPKGGTHALSSDIVWSPWYGQDKEWIQINASVEAQANRLTVFIEADDPESGGQDQVYIDNVWLEEEGAPPPPTRTPVPTVTPTPTATPAIAVLRSVNVGRQPQGIAVLPSINRFFVANSGGNTLSSLEGFLEWQHTEIGSHGEGPSNVAIDPDRYRMYVVNTAENNVAVFDACTSQHIDSVPLGDGRSPKGIAVLGNTIYVANAAAHSVSVIDGNTLTVTKTIAVEQVPEQIAVNPQTNKVYVTNRGYSPENAGSVTVIDGSTQERLRTIDLSYTAPKPAPGPYGVAVNPVTNQVYVASTSGKLVIIDGESDKVVDVVLPPVPTGLDGVAVNPASNNVFVSSGTANTVFVYDADVGGWICTLTVGSGLFRGIAVNPLTYHVLVSNTADDTVSIIRDSGAYQPFSLWIPMVRK